MIVDEWVRIGDKLLSRERLLGELEKIFAARSRGLSQREAADLCGVDRSFVSRLEGLAEIRRGPKIALVGFPVAHPKELRQIAEKQGVEWVLLLSEEERQALLQRSSGAQLLNWVLEMVAKARNFDQVILLGSDYRIRVVEALLGRSVIGYILGASPLTKDVVVDPEKLRQLIDLARKA